MEVYQTKAGIIPGTSFKTVEKIALKLFKKIKSKTKRTPYIRSAYFKKEKVFLNIFWSHLHQRNEKDKTRRLKNFECAIDLIKNSKIEPSIKENPNNKSELLYRFIGKTRGGEIFVVQIKMNRNNKKKYLISVFPQN